VLTGVHAASDAAALRRDLERQGLHIFELRRRGLPIHIPWPMLRRRRRIPTHEFLAFNQELAALLRAGLPLLQSLDIMLERMDNQTLREVLTEVRDKVKSGAELSEAFAGFGDLFPRLYSATLKAGERSGELEKVIRRFMRYLRLVLDARKRALSALIYPAVLIGLSIAMLIVMSIFVIPKFAKFYDDLDAELPQLTQITLGISFWLRENILWLLPALVIGVVALRSWIDTDAGRETFDRVRLRLPLVGAIFHQFALSEFCRSLATLLAGGLPLMQAFEIAVDAISNRHVGGRIRPAIDKVREGRAFNQALDEAEVFPPITLDMIKVGETTGSLDEMLANVSDYLDEKVEVRLQRLLALLEPVLLVIMGGLIALILISVYLPMLKAFGQVGR